MTGDLSRLRGLPGHVGRTISQSGPAWPNEPTAPSGSPNIVVILLDDLGFADIGPYGSEIATPNLDHLARDGVRFTNYHTTPLCSPSRAALLTGLNPHRAGFAFPANSDPGYPAFTFELPEDAPTLAESLQASGYATFAVGKWHLTGDRSTTPPASDPGLPAWLRPLLRQPRGVHARCTRPTGSSGTTRPTTSTVRRRLLPDRRADRPSDLDDPVPAPRDQKPFFLYLAHHAVHGPIQAKAADVPATRAGTTPAGTTSVRSGSAGRSTSACSGGTPPSTQQSRSG